MEKYMKKWSRKEIKDQGSKNHFVGPFTRFHCISLLPFWSLNPGEGYSFKKKNFKPSPFATDIDRYPSFNPGSEGKRKELR